jgi:hypothetical protein
MPSPLDNLCGPGKALQAEAPDANELAGLLVCSMWMSGWCQIW